MRRVRYAVAASLDGYIVGPKEELDWIVMDPEIDFNAIYAKYDTVLIGRKTFEIMARGGQAEAMTGMRTFVFSRTLRPSDHPSVIIIAQKAEETVAALRAGSGKDIWLFGGGALFRSLHDAGLVDTVEVAVMPTLLGAGTPLMPPPYRHTKLTLTGHQVYETGIVSLEYAVQSVVTARGRVGRRKRSP